MNYTTVKPSPRLPLKVVYIVSDLSVGGAEMALYRLLAATNRQRFSPVVLTLIDQGDLRQRIEELDIPVYTGGMKPGRPTPGAMWRVFKLLRQLKPDLILGWMYHGCLVAALFSCFKRKTTPVVWSVHYSLGTSTALSLLTTLVIKACRLFSRVPAHIVFVSRFGKEQHEGIGFYTKNSSVVPNGVEVNKFKPSEIARQPVRRELQLDNDTILVGLIGRYHYMKDHANFLRAAAMTAQNHPDVHYVLVGRGVDQENEALRELIEQYDLGRLVHLLGEKPDTTQLTAALDIFALSSYEESCPNVICEAMACGVPCVVTNVGDVVAIVGNTGLVVPPRDSKALSLALDQMIELGQTGRSSLGHAARSRIVELFPIERTVERYERLFERLLAIDEVSLADPPELIALSQPLKNLGPSV